MTKPIEVETLSSKPNKPKITYLSQEDNGDLLVYFDYPCPYTGATFFKLSVKCQVDSVCDNDHFDDTKYESIEEGLIKVC